MGMRGPAFCSIVSHVMARELRVQYEGTIYDVTVRGMGNSSAVCPQLQNLHQKIVGNPQLAARIE